MPRIFTHPDMEFDRSIPKVFIRNCTWTEEEIQNILEELDSDKNYDIYLYNDSVNDIQWAEGVRTQSRKTVDCRHYQGQNPINWLKAIDNEF